MLFYFFFFFFNDTATTEIYTLSLHDALPILPQHPRAVPAPYDAQVGARDPRDGPRRATGDRGEHRRPQAGDTRSEEHTSELQSRQYLVCRLLLEKKKKKKKQNVKYTKSSDID